MSGFSHIGTELGEEGLLDPNEAMLCGRLKNSDSLHVLLGHPDLVKQAQLINLIENMVGFFGDTPTQTNVLEHDIEVSDTKPIRQHFYRVHPGNRRFLDEEVQYMLDNGIAETSNSSWASLLVPKPDNTL